MPFYCCYKINYVILFMINVKGKTEGSPKVCYGDATQSAKESENITLSSWALNRNLKESVSHDVQRVAHWPTQEKQRVNRS